MNNTNNSPKKLHDDPVYKSTKEATCVAFAGFFSYLTGGSPMTYAAADKFCHAVADVAANPAHKLIHGESYEEKQKNLKP